MNVYLRGYAQRYKGIVISILCIMCALVFGYLLFQGKIIKIDNQLKTYNSDNYSLIYVLNYYVPMENVCVYPDTDAQIYMDQQKHDRLTVSALMRNAGDEYSVSSLQVLNDIKPGEIAVCRNVSEKFGLNGGETLWVEFPFSSDLYEYHISEIADYNYDFSHPIIDNDIGIVLLGYNSAYTENVQSKYALFSAQSKADELSAYPQVINGIINKADNAKAVFEQCVSSLIFQVLFIMIAIIVAHLAFLRHSETLLRRCFLKGMKRNALVFIPLVEKVIFIIVPCIAIEMLFQLFTPIHSIVTKLYYYLPVLICLIYSVVSAGLDSKRSRKIEEG